MTMQSLVDFDREKGRRELQKNGKWERGREKVARVQENLREKI